MVWNILNKKPFKFIKKYQRVFKYSLIIAIPSTICTISMLCPITYLTIMGLKTLSNNISVTGIPFESSFESSETPIAKNNQ
ncbi:MAG: hypothetical protein LBF36_03590 [Mycoplasmataceae bacterium]|nr:hypothetical protein [Mycoplasmataceae bacterium]